MKNMLFIVILVIIGTSANQLLDRTLTSSLVVGGIPYLSYANKLSGFVKDIFVVSLPTVMYMSGLESSV